MAVVAAVVIMVNRVGGSQVFFDLVGRFQADRLLKDATAKMAVLDSLMLDTMSGIADTFADIGAEVQNLIDSTVPLGEELGFARIEFEKFMEAADDLDAIEQQIIDLGAGFGFTGDQALAAGSRMAQLSTILGGGQAVVAATQMGVAFGMISGMETRDAMTRLINLQQQTQFMHGELTKAQFESLTEQQKANQITANTIEVMDQLNTVENRSAATLQQLTFVMNQFAAQAHLAGDSIAEMAAMSATLIEAGEEQGKAGRALRMVYARIGADTSGAASMLEDMGIATKNTDGSIRSLTEIMTDLSSATRGSNDQTKQAIAQVVAGNNHYVRFLKLLENFDRTTELTGMALNDQATAQEELRRVTESSAFQYKAARAELETTRAEIGEALIPAMTAATRHQQKFADGFKDIVESDKLGGAVTGAVFLKDAMGDTVGAMIRMAINAFALNVAMRTNMILTKSLFSTEQQLVDSGAMTLNQQKAKAELARIVELHTRGHLDAQNKITQMVQLELNNQTAKHRVVTQLSQSDIVSLQILERKADAEREVTLAKLSSLDAELAMTRARINDAQVMETLRKGELTDLELKRQALNDIQGKTKQERQANYEKIRTEDMHNSLIQEKKNLTNQIRDIDFQRVRELLKEMNLQEGISNELREQLEMIRMQLAGQDQASLLVAELGLNTHNAAKATALLNDNLKAFNIISNANTTVQVRDNRLKQEASRIAAMVAQATGMSRQQQDKLTESLFRQQQQSANNIATNEKLTASMMNSRTTAMKMSGALGGASMLLGMFAQNSDQARKAMILMNASMVPMMASMMGLNKATIANAKAALAARTANLSFAASIGVVTGSIVMFLGKAALIVGAIALVLELADAFLFASDGADELNNSMATFIALSAEDLHQAYADFSTDSYADVGVAISNVSKEIENTEKTAQSLEGAERAMHQHKIDRLNEELSMLQQIQSIKGGEEGLAVLEKMGKTEAENLIALQNVFEDFAGEDIPTKMAAQIGKFNLGGALGQATYAGDMQRTMEALGLSPAEIERFFQNTQLTTGDAMGAIYDMLSDDQKKMFDDLSRDGIDTYEELEKFYRDSSSLPELLTEDAEEKMADMGDSIDILTDKLHEFGSSREELFYGFAAGNVTGDMIKQVTQKGVDTLINNTEVIMNNRFMGMTTEEAANAIVSQIQSQLATVDGVNISLTN